MQLWQLSPILYGLELSRIRITSPLCCVLGRDTLLPQRLSPPGSINGYRRIVRATWQKCWGVGATCDGLASQRESRLSGFTNIHEILSLLSEGRYFWESLLSNFMPHHVSAAIWCGSSELLSNLHDLLFFLLDLIPRNTSSQRKDTMKLDFESMRIEKRYNRLDIRRLSSESSVKQQDTDCLATQWLWFRKEETGDWVKYGVEVRRICSSKLGRTRGSLRRRRTWPPARRLDRWLDG